jgi:hypothetical protein
MGLIDVKSPGSVPLLASPPLILPQTQFEGDPNLFPRPFTWEYAAIKDASIPARVDSCDSDNKPTGGISKKSSLQLTATIIAVDASRAPIFSLKFFIFLINYSFYNSIQI